MNELANRIKKLRTNQEMTTTELGRRVHKSQSTISAIENGYTALKADELSIFAKALGVSTYFLLTETDDSNSAIARETGLSNKTINKIKALNQKKKKLLELLINDEGLTLSGKALKDNPELEPEPSFMDALSQYVCDPIGNRIVEIQRSGSGTEEDPYVEKIIQAKHGLMIKQADGSIRDVSEWRMDSKPVLSRLKAVRAKYLQGLEPQKYSSTEEEDDDE